ncbi:MAG TPA: hypothetical protein DCG14_07860 [Phycisphaerales bacterium]|nr:hypothetical protein [Phycisphaerales bacterium]
MPLLHAVRRWFNRDRPLDIDSTHLIAEPVAPAPERIASGDGFRPVSLAPTLDDHPDAVTEAEPDQEPPEARRRPLTATETSSEATMETTTAGLATDAPEDPRAAMRRIEEALTSGRDSQAAIAEAVGRVRPAAAAIEQMAERQQRLLELAERQVADAGRRDDRTIEAIERMTDHLGRSNEVTGLVQRQLDANHEIVRETVTRLDQVAVSIDEGRRASEAIGVAMSAMVDEMKRRDEAHETRNGVLQGWVVASVVACIAATGAALALAWAVMGMQS